MPMVEVFSRTLAELGPWLWMIFGFIFVGAEIFISRRIALSIGLAAIITSIMAITGESGIMPRTSFEIQTGVFMLFCLTLIGISKRIWR